MEYIHFKKLIHRDLKLENVLLTNELVAKISEVILVFQNRRKTFIKILKKNFN
jgi:serine/threonine protein kinase